VTPDRQRSGCDLLATHRRRDRVVVIRDFERPEAPLARVDRCSRVFAAALSTSQTLNMGRSLAHDLRLLSVRRALERLERRAALRLSPGSGIGTLLTGGDPPVRWLPRRQRACPSAALDERVHAHGSTGLRPDSQRYLLP